MKVVCVDSKFDYEIDDEFRKPLFLTKGKIYELIEYKRTTRRKVSIFRFIDDYGDEMSYELYKDNFITLDEWRDIKLKELGI